jgi:hypothetical protein
MEFRYPVESVAHDAAANSWRLAPDFDHATDLWQVAPLANADGMRVALFDPAGRIVTQGAFSADLPLILEGPETAIRLDRVEIDGELVLLVPSAPLEPGHRYDVSYPDWQAGGSATPEEIATLPALGGGTLIATDEGEMPIDWLRPGDKILTRDNGYQQLLWLGQHIVPRRSPHELRPLRLESGQFGQDQPAQPLVITPGCPVLLAGAELELWFGESEMFARASDLIDEPPRAPGRQAVYTLLFDVPEVVLAGGLWTGTVHADSTYLSLLPTGMRAIVAPYLLGLHLQPARAYLAQWEVEMFTRESVKKKDTMAA